MCQLHVLFLENMSALEKIAANLKLTELKKNSLRKAILLLTVEWKDLDEHLESTQQCFEGRFSELESREKSLNSVQESVAESNRELDLIRKSIEKRFEEVDSKEKLFQSFAEKQIEEFKSRENQLLSARRSVEGRIEEVRLGEERLAAQQKSVEGLFEKLEWEQKQFESIQQKISERLNEIRLKEKHIEDRSMEIDLIQNWIERRANELDGKEERVIERSKELELKETGFYSIRKEFELKEKQLECVQRLNERRTEELDSREKQLDSVKKFVHDTFKEFQSKKKQFQLDKNEFEERLKGFELKEKQVEERLKEFELKENQFHINEEQIEDTSANNAVNHLSADIHFHVTMDGQSLQMFLNEREKDHASMSGEVCNALRLSLDPAKLVLDAMVGFYPPHLKKGDAEFKGSVVKRSCILLLKQSIKIRPQIRPYVKGEARKLADEWRVKMRMADKFFDVLGFLYLIASYGLASAFDVDELLSLLQIVAQHDEAPELCQLLGFTSKIPDLVEILIRMKQHVVAVQFIFAFELVDKFPPVPILKNYLKYVKRIAKNMCKKENYSLKAQNEAIDKRTDAIRSVIKCIIDHKLESQFSPALLEKVIAGLIACKARKNASTPPGKSLTKFKSQVQRANKRRRIATSASNAPIHNAYPVYSIQEPPQHPEVSFTGQCESYLRSAAAHCSLGEFTAVIPPGSHLDWDCGPNTLANRETMAFGFDSPHFGMTADSITWPAPFSRTQYSYQSWWL